MLSEVYWHMLWHDLVRSSTVPHHPDAVVDKNFQNLYLHPVFLVVPLDQH